MEAPFHPIVYLRGYAFSQNEIEDTVADPYMGFNLGSTKIRQTWDRQIVRYLFESPLIRLMKDHGYQDVYLDGEEISLAGQVPARSIWIYRYYEGASRDLGSGVRPDMETRARGLGDLIERIRGLVGGGPDFRVNLVAHSMGGLIARCYLQKIAKGRESHVHRVFTYATPHGGIDVGVVGNVPGWLRVNDTQDFNRTEMARYLGVKDVQSLGAFPPERFFCLVGTNHRDYEAAGGLSRWAVGPMSDGLVRIENATVNDAPRAFVHRAHSGHYGIVNSEEGYQNLRRFLFGDVRVDVLLELDELALPPEVQKRKDAGAEVHASYHVESVVRVRGARYDLHRRTVEDASAFFLDYDRYVRGDRQAHLASVFLLDQARVVESRKSLGFSLDLGIQVPEYTVGGLPFLRDHYQGGYLYREKINLELVPSADGQPDLRWGLDSQTPNRTSRRAQVTGDKGVYDFVLPVEQKTRPGASGRLLLRTRPHG